jgi:hypothetical protein
MALHITFINLTFIKKDITYNKFYLLMPLLITVKKLASSMAGEEAELCFVFVIHKLCFASSRITLNKEPTVWLGGVCNRVIGSRAKVRETDHFDPAYFCFIVL